MTPHRAEVWRLMRRRHAQQGLERIARHWACHDMADAHCAAAAVLLEAACDAQLAHKLHQVREAARALLARLRGSLTF